jgi:hypothetical protein
MTPAQIELARQAVALPGWAFSPPESHKMEPRRSQRGILWVRSAHPRGPWVPSLMDDSGATDGVLLKLLGPGWSMCRTSEGVIRLLSTRRPGLAVLTVQEGVTLAEACCRAAVAFGRWPGGLP